MIRTCSFRLASATFSHNHVVNGVYATDQQAALHVFLKLQQSKNFRFLVASTEDTHAWQSERFFSSGGGSSRFLHGMAKKLPWASAVVKFHFTNSKLREKNFLLKIE